jgi:hypothetical protein
MSLTLGTRLGPYEIRGLIGLRGPVVDLSRQVLGDLVETALGQSALQDVATGQFMTYPTRWWVPFNSSVLDQTLNTTPATRRCDGGDPGGVQMVRVDGTYPTSGPIDWDANGLLFPQDLATIAQDVDFNGVIGDPVRDGTFHGFNDWFNLDMRQTASRRNRGRLSIEITTNDLLNLGDPGLVIRGSVTPGLATPGSATPALATPGSAIQDSAIRDSAIRDSAIRDSAIRDSAIPDSGRSSISHEPWISATRRTA